jgi:hypothetical protein
MDVFLMRVRQVGPASWLWTVAAPETGGDAYTVPGLRKGMCPTRVEAVNEARDWIEWLHIGPRPVEVSVIEH